MIYLYCFKFIELETLSFSLLDQQNCMQISNFYSTKFKCCMLIIFFFHQLMSLQP